MAALLIVGALAIADKVEQKKAKRLAKKANDEKRYRELQLETNQRLARRDSGGNAISTFSFDDDEQSGSEENVKEARDEEPPPPAYEDAVAAGQRREREWRVRMERRRSSVQSQRSGGGKEREGTSEMRMG